MNSQRGKTGRERLTNQQCPSILRGNNKNAR